MCQELGQSSPFPISINPNSWRIGQLGFKDGNRSPEKVNQQPKHIQKLNPRLLIPEPVLFLGQRKHFHSFVPAAAGRSQVQNIYFAIEKLSLLILGLLQRGVHLPAFGTQNLGAQQPSWPEPPGVECIGEDFVWFRVNAHFGALACLALQRSPSQR